MCLSHPKERLEAILNDKQKDRMTKPVFHTLCGCFVII